MLVELERNVAYLGRRDWDGIPECCILDPKALLCLHDLALDCDFGLMGLGIETATLRAWLANTAAAPLAPPDRVFGEVDDFVNVLIAATLELGVGPVGRSGVYVGWNAGRQAVAKARGWTACEDLSWVRKRLGGEPIVLFEAKGLLADDAAVFEPMSDPGRPLVLPMRLESADGRSLRAKIAPASLPRFLSTVGGEVEILDSDLSGSFVFELETGELSVEEEKRFAVELARLPFYRRSGRHVFGTMPVRLGDRPPHPHPVPHGYASLLIAEPALQSVAPSPGPLDPVELSVAEAAAIAGISDDDYRTIHEAVMNSGGPGVAGGLPDRRFGFPGNRSALDQAATFLGDTLGERFVYDPIVFGARFGADSCNVDARVAGTDATAGIVVLGAHIDSCSLLSGGGVAPGADDDASGVAAVLLAAQVLAGFAQASPPRREIRFVLFNAEESGMTGSWDYVQDLQGQGIPVAAMVQLDMIGWRSAGCSPAFDVRGPGAYRSDHKDLAARSEEIAMVIRAAAGGMAPCFPVAGVPGGGTAPGFTIGRTPPDADDPLAERSDHTSFYRKGYPACLVCEPNLGAPTDAGDPCASGNPAYHTDQDRTIDYTMAAAIARTVIAAVWSISKN